MESSGSEKLGSTSLAILASALPSRASVQEGGGQRRGLAAFSGALYTPGCVHGPSPSLGTSSQL